MQPADLHSSTAFSSSVATFGEPLLYATSARCRAREAAEEAMGKEGRGGKWGGGEIEIDHTLFRRPSTTTRCTRTLNERDCA